MFLWFFVSYIFAHEPIGQLLCKHQGQVIRISERNNTWLVDNQASGKKNSLTKPKSQDFWDKKNKQLFDIYIFKVNEQSYELKVPEGPGPIKKTQLKFDNQTWVCQDMTSETPQ